MPRGKPGLETLVALKLEAFMAEVLRMRYWLCQVIAYALLGLAQASATPLDLCDAAARHAAGNADVPADMLRAIARVETGRVVDGRLAAWPWTVNMEGQGYWFESKQAAQEFVRVAYARGARNFDIGCFQINYRWHGGAFDSVEAMFDPRENALYAARFLQELRGELGTWSNAVGAYHSRQPHRAKGYLDRFEEVQAGLDSLFLSEPRSTARTAPAESVPAQNGYPLLQKSNGSARAGSLVPMGETRRYVILFNPITPVGF